ncbi:helix-turn-helix domain-containing protein [Nonomuraea maheshkhaliensis]|uniref:Helix-turn-helix domain-containing protein n=2 Tax=Nonomuraea maheshkhaliensis TaxID=419590 RepID=A0ABN2HWW5_9ACTN
MYAERHPGPGLADRIACGWHRISEAPYTQLVVPDACVDLIWGASGLFVAGPDTGPMPASVASGETVVGIRFRPGAVGDFFGVPLHELRDRRVPLTDLPGHEPLLADLLDPPPAPLPQWRPQSPGFGLPDRALDRAPDRAPDDALRHPPPVTGPPQRGVAPPTRVAEAEARLGVMRAVVGRRLAAAPADPAARAMATALGSGRSVAQVAWDLGYSERQLQRRSVTSFGYAPKTLQRVVRFQRALRLAREGVPPAEVAVRAGFTDQAHLANDVKRLSGVQLSRLI